ncbi:hypothetical protein GCM10010320_74890 [Streptomyces caelestis]|nr:hypothetical protein GCM10010320_74890 [Streptomyces caelestis]
MHAAGPQVLVHDDIAVVLKKLFQDAQPIGGGVTRPVRPRAALLLHSRGGDSLDEIALADEEDDEDRDQRDDGHREQ